MNTHKCAARSLAALLLVSLSSAQTPAQTNSPKAKLKGILSLPELKVALLEPLAKSPWNKAGLILGEDEREGDVSVKRIDARSGSVELLGSTNITLQSESCRLEGTGLALDQVGLGAALSVYQKLVGRTLLRHPSLPSVTVTLNAAANSKQEAAVALEKALTKQRIIMIPDGDKFTMVVPESQASAAKPGLSLISSANTASKGDNEIVPAGTIDFREVPLIDAAKIYAKLRGRELDKVESDFELRAAPPMTITTQNDLTKDECIYALETLFGWHGFRIILTGNDQVQFVKR
jgi:hypothetical protein